jgi:hypothetical protein
MRSRSFTLFAIAVLAFNSAAFSVFAQPSQTPGEAELVKFLPASDAVVAINVRRLLKEALPTLFSSKPEWAATLKTTLDDFQGKAGFDIRTIETAVIGFSIRQTEGGKYDMQPVVLAKGAFNGDSLVTLLRAAADKDKDVRVEKVGTKTMVIIDVKEDAKKAGDKAADAAADANEQAKDMIDKVENPFSDEMAVAAMPNGAIAVGTVPRVRETLLANTKLDPAIPQMLAKYPSAVAKFGSMTPAGMSEYLPVDNDFLGDTLNGIRTLAGAMDVTSATSTFMLSTSTEIPEQAKGIFDMLDGLMMIGKNIFGPSKRADQQTFLRLLEAAKLTQTGNSVDLTLPVAQSDIDALVGMIKEKKADEVKADEAKAADENESGSADAAKPADDQN